MADTLPSNLTVKELEDSGAPGVSAMKRWYDSVKGGSSAIARAKMHAAAAGQGVRQGGESLLIGGILGAAHVKLKNGLDLKSATSTGSGVPIDAVVGVVGLVGGAAFAHEEFGVDLRNSGAAALGIFSFRKTYTYLAAKAKTANQPVGGTFSSDDDEGFVNGDFGGEDPIVAAARFL